MTEKVRISVIIPVYNAADYLPRSVGSVVMQEFDEYEVILVNDGSTDDSAAVCEQLASQDMRIRVINKENGGVSSARNAGISAARGEYIMFLDADDAIRDGAFENMYDQTSDLVLAGFEKVLGTTVTETYCPPSGKIYSGTMQICAFFDQVLPRKNTYILNSACFKLFRRSVIEQNEIRFVDGLSFAEDKMFVMTYLKYVEQVRTVPSVVYSYFLRSGSLSSNMKSEAHAVQVLGLLDVYLPLLRALEQRYSGSDRIINLYHQDFVSRYVCRILDILATRTTQLLTFETIKRLYGYIDADPSAGVFGYRIGQIPNMILYKIRKPGLTKAFYHFTSSLLGK